MEFEKRGIKFLKSTWTQYKNKKSLFRRNNIGHRVEPVYEDVKGRDEEDAGEREVVDVDGGEVEVLKVKSTIAKQVQRHRQSGNNYLQSDVANS